MAAITENETEQKIEEEQTSAPTKRHVAQRASTAFSCIAAFEDAQRMAKALSSSDLVPKQYSGNLPNCILALEMSQRLGMNPLMVMQNMYIVHGKPAWSSQFMIACINGSGHFSPLRYELSGKENSDERKCIAWAYDKATGERLESPAVSIGMAKKEGWYDKNGSKWQTMPELMLRYRTATFFARTYCPELTMGMQTTDEIHDVGEAVVVADDPLSPGRHTRKRAETAFDVNEAKSDAPTEICSPESSPAESGPSIPADACSDYAELVTANNRTPRFVERAIEKARSHDECANVKVFYDIDHTDSVQCGIILTAFQRIHDSAKGK